LLQHEILILIKSIRKCPTKKKIARLSQT